MHASMSASATLLTRYLAEYLTHFHQTYINDVLWDRDECVKFWGQKVTVQVQVGTVTAQASTVLDVSCRVRLSSFYYSLVFIV